MVMAVVWCVCGLGAGPFVQQAANGTVLLGAKTLRTSNVTVLSANATMYHPAGTARSANASGPRTADDTRSRAEATGYRAGVDMLESNATARSPNATVQIANATAHAANATEGGADARHSACRGLPSKSFAPRAVAVCFFGINRSLNYTIGSIRALIFEPLRRACLEPELYVHTYSLNATVHSRRTREGEGGRIGGWREMRELLEPAALDVSDQHAFLREMRQLLPFPSSTLSATGPGVVRAGRVWRSPEVRRNWLCQLNSLMRVTQLWLPRAHALRAVVYIRPDLQPLQPLDALALASVQPREMYLPYWGLNKGLNDRMAFGAPDAAAAYGMRLMDLRMYLAAGNQPHSEHFLSHALRIANVRVRYTSGRAVRVRAGGIGQVADAPLRNATWWNSSGHNASGLECTVAAVDADCSRAWSSRELELAELRRSAEAAGLADDAQLPGHCADVPEYGTPRRRALVVLASAEYVGEDLGETSRVLHQHLLAPLLEACVLPHVVLQVCPAPFRSATEARVAPSDRLRAALVATAARMGPPGLIHWSTLASPQGACEAQTSSGDLRRQLASQLIFSDELSHVFSQSHAVITLDVRTERPASPLHVPPLMGLPVGHVMVESGRQDELNTTLHNTEGRLNDWINSVRLVIARVETARGFFLDERPGALLMRESRRENWLGWLRSAIMVEQMPMELTRVRGVALALPADPNTHAIVVRVDQAVPEQITARRRPTKRWRRHSDATVGTAGGIARSQSKHRKPAKRWHQESTRFPLPIHVRSPELIGRPVLLSAEHLHDDDDDAHPAGLVVRLRAATPTRPTPTATTSSSSAAAV